MEGRGGGVSDGLTAPYSGLNKAVQPGESMMAASSSYKAGSVILTGVCSFFSKQGISLTKDYGFFTVFI